MKQLQLLDADGQPVSAFSFGEVAPGQMSAPKAVTLTNTGDEALTGLKVWIVQASSADGELRVTLNGTPVTGTSLATATALPDLAAGAGHSGTAEFTSPTVSVDTGALHWQAN